MMNKRLVTVFIPTILLVWMLLVETGTSVCCTYPSSPSTTVLTVAEAWTPQPAYPLGWYYITGYLCVTDSLSSQPDLLSCNDPIGFQLTTYLTSKLVAVLGTNTTKVALQSESVFAVSSQEGRFSTLVVGRPILSISVFPTYNIPVPSASSPFDFGFAALPTPNVTMSYTYVPGSNGSVGYVGSEYQFYATSPTASLSLTAVSQAPTMFHGNGGYFHPPNPANCTGYYYVSMPQLVTTGIISFNGQNYSVKGVSWMDNQFTSKGALSGSGGNSSSSSSSSGGGWTWTWFQIGTSSVMLEIAHSGQEHLLSASHAEVQLIDGTMIEGGCTSITVLKTWTSPTTAIVYPIDVIITTNVDVIPTVHLYVDPTRSWMLDQEVPAGGYWEGMVLGSVTVGKTETSVFGYLELIGYGGFNMTNVDSSLYNSSSSSLSMGFLCSSSFFLILLSWLVLFY